jgi:hypothetical protein
LIAEIHHKVSSTGSNLNEKLEDELTGNFFGNLRYIPFRRGLGKIISHYTYDDQCIFHNTFSDINTDEWNTEFWRKSISGLGEIDCYMSELDNNSLGIEVKYKSDLSSEDQLEREALMMKEWNTKGKLFLLFIAPRKDYCRQIYNQNKTRVEMNDVTLGFLAWEDALLGLNLVETETPFEKIIIEDIRDLLIGKGFAGFHGFLFHENFEIEESNLWVFKRNINKASALSFIITEPVIGEEAYEFRRKY